MSGSRIRVVSFYHFVALSNLDRLRDDIERKARAYGLKGIFLMATEGVNTTLAGSVEALASFMEWIRPFLGNPDLDCKDSWASEMPFFRLKVRIKKEIITMGRMGRGDEGPRNHHVEASDWNALIADPSVVLLDTRNDYECRIGTFQGAINPETEHFSEFPDYVDAHLDPSKQKKVAIFCTGGVRCEKASVHLLERGFEVYQLKGGILRYLEDVDADQSRWEGECFVFDQRVSLGHGLAQGDHSLCFGCRMPLSPQDRASDQYEEGVCCEHCHARLSEAKKAGLRQRHYQMSLARERNQAHLGNPSCALPHDD